MRKDYYQKKVTTVKNVKQMLWDEITRRFDLSKQGDSALDNITLQQIPELLSEDDLIKVVFQDYYIKRCKLCGKLFVTSDNRVVYCTRMVDDKHTCREVGAGIVRGRDPITREMDSARRLHLRRRAEATKVGADSANQQYDAWLTYARSKEAACRAGTIGLSELKAAIGNEYTDDLCQRK